MAGAEIPDTEKPQREPWPVDQYTATATATSISMMAKKH
jgi:hypothetical protein